MSRCVWRIVVGLALVLSVWPTGPAAAFPPSKYPYYFTERWALQDTPVQTGRANRSWVWGNSLIDPGTDLEFQGVRYEPYAEGFQPPPNCNQITGCGIHDIPGQRPVMYFDKARMEWNYHVSGSDAALWQVTTGLLVEELITGRMQLGDTLFEQHEPARIPVAGDSDSLMTPSYAALGTRLHDQPAADGQIITQTLAADGSAGSDQGFVTYGVTAIDVGALTQHTVAAPFWDFMNSSGTLYALQSTTYYEGRLFANPFYATGYPITEPYWTQAKVGGVVKDVLLQCFERRCLTYTPDNPDGWKVEFGNVGQHYYFWRYGTRPWE